MLNDESTPEGHLTLFPSMAELPETSKVIVHLPQLELLRECIVR